MRRPLRSPQARSSRSNRAAGRRASRGRRPRASSSRWAAAKRAQVVRRSAPADVRIAANGAESRTRRIDQRPGRMSPSAKRQAVRRPERARPPRSGRGIARACRASRRTRCGRTSDATTTPSRPTSALIASVLPPGDAQRSRTRSPAAATASSPIKLRGLVLHDEPSLGERVGAERAALDHVEGRWPHGPWARSSRRSSASSPASASRVVR